MKKANNDNSNAFTATQFSILVGVLLGDGWLEVSSPTSNARLGFQFTVKNDLLFDVIYLTFQEWITENPKIVDKAVQEGKYTTASSEPKFQKKVRTGYNAIFTTIHRMFYILENGRWIKVFPTVTDLYTLLTPLAFAYLLLCDGSRKSKNTSGYEIHLQGVGFESVARLCLVLHEKWGITSWPAFDNHKKKGVSYWVVYIASVSYPKWAPLVIDEVRKVGMYDQKMPLTPKTAPRENSKTKQRFQTFLTYFGSDDKLRNDLSYRVPPERLKEYWGM